MSSPCNECGFVPLERGWGFLCFCTSSDSDDVAYLLEALRGEYAKMEARAVSAEQRLGALVEECEGSLTDSDPGNALYRVRKALRAERAAGVKTPRKKSETRKVLQTLAEEVRDMARHAANCAPLHREDPVVLVEKIELDGFVNTALTLLTD